MRTLLVLLLVTVLASAFTVVNLCNAPQDYAEKTVSWLKMAYDMYSKDVKAPALCPDFYVELRDIEYGGLTYTRISGGGVCAYKIVIDCGMTDTQLLHISFHEMAHALQAAYYNGKPYGWYTEAHAEGIATYYLVERVWKAGAWQSFGWAKYFWSDRLYEKNPEQCTAPDLCAYKYGAFFAWLAWRYGPRNATEVYAASSYQIIETYRNFLLSPWDWGRDPYYYDYSECRGRSMVANSLLPCVYGAAGNYVYVFSSNTLINATLRDGVIYLALVAPGSTTADPSVTISNCNCPGQTTVTVTTTKTVTQTVTVPTTTTVTVPTTYTTTVPTTTTYTTTVTTTYTTTYISTVPVTTTVTTTVPTTYTTTVTVPTTTTIPITVTTTSIVTSTVTATETVTKTVAVPVATTVTATYTETVSVTTTTTTTKTVTVTEHVESDRRTLIIVAVVALVVGCFVCSLLGRRGAHAD